MKFTITKQVEVDIILLNVNAKVRYWENATVNGEQDVDGTLIPCRNGDMWQPIIEIQSGCIINWEKGKTASVHYKVCDCCGWSLDDMELNTVISTKDGYVPDTLCPNDEGYGDYIIMDIDANGMIQNWQFKINDFVNAE